MVDQMEPVVRVGRPDELEMGSQGRDEDELLIEDKVGPGADSSGPTEADTTTGSWSSGGPS